MKEKLLGKTITIRKGDIYGEEIGKVVAVVKERRRKIYIVQFKNDWNYFGKSQLREER